MQCYTCGSNWAEGHLIEQLDLYLRKGVGVCPPCFNAYCEVLGVPNKEVIILRGAPGSGKSTEAELIAKSEYYDGFPTIIVSADNYRYFNGLYTFNEKTLADGHTKCFRDFCWAVDCSFPMVIVDNTNIGKKHYEAYVDYAQSHGYTVYQKVMRGEYDNIHNVPLSIVRRHRLQLDIDVDLPHWEN